MKAIDPSKAYRLLYPSVPVIVAAQHRGKTSAMPVVSLVFLSNKPAIVGVSISPSHDTFGAVMGAGRFTVSWLGEELQKEVEKMGTVSGSELPDKLSACGFHHEMKGTPPVPGIAEAVAFLVCRVAEEKTFGDHKLVVADVEEASASEDFSEYWSFKSYRPILYTGISGPALRLPLSRES